jgi:hypothetical protein
MSAGWYPKLVKKGVVSIEGSTGLPVAPGEYGYERRWDRDG